jgi:putative toxin-antitoxin system antitoxin component (TIGR02293 family)
MARGQSKAGAALAGGGEAKAKKTSPAAAAKPIAAARLRAGKVPLEVFARSYQAAPRDKIAEIRRGVPARRIGELSSVMDIPKESLMDFLGLSRATINRKAQKDQPLSRDESERVVGVQTLIGQVQAMIEDAGAAAGFDAAKWVSRWLNEPSPALGGEKPADYMDTVEGQKLVGNLLAMAESGAYA